MDKIGFTPGELRRSVLIPVEGATLEGELDIPGNAPGVVLFVHGSGSSRHSPRNQYVASRIREAHIGTLLFDLLTLEEEEEDRFTREYRFDIQLLANRLMCVTRWLKTLPETRNLRIGYFGSSTGGGAALEAAARLGGEIGAVVSRGGRPDLALEVLSEVTAPTLFVVGGCDEVVLDLNQTALTRLRCEKSLWVVPGATHLFEEPGALEQVATVSAEWFQRHLVRAV